MITITIDNIPVSFDTHNMPEDGARLIDKLETHARLLRLLRQLLRQRIDQNYYWRSVRGNGCVLLIGGGMTWERCGDPFYKQEAAMYPY